MSDKVIETNAYKNRIQQESQQLALKTTVANKSVIIQKNDSMNKRIDEIIKWINQGNAILLSGKSATIAKLIGIVEIVKTKTKLQQFNKLIKQESSINPNHRHTNKASKSQAYTLPILLIYLVPPNVKVDILWTQQ